MTKIFLADLPLWVTSDSGVAWTMPRKPWGARARLHSRATSVCLSVNIDPRRLHLSAHSCEIRILWISKFEPTIYENLAYLASRRYRFSYNPKGLDNIDGKTAQKLQQMPPYCSNRIVWLLFSTSLDHRCGLPRAGYNAIIPCNTKILHSNNVLFLMANGTMQRHTCG